MPVILRTVTRVSHARSNVTIGDIKKSEIKDEFDLSKEVNVASRIYFLDKKKIKYTIEWIKQQKYLKLAT